LNILRTLKNFIPEAHRAAIKQIFERRKLSGDLFNSRTAEFEAKRLLETIALSDGGKVFVPQHAVPGTKISSESHNRNLEAAFIDLCALYRQTAYLGTKTAKNNTLIQDEFNKSRAAILKLINDARIYVIRNAKPEYDDIKLINFNTAFNKSTIPPSAMVDAQTRLLKLPEVIKSRNHLRRRDLRYTTITTETRGGFGGQLTNAFPPEKAVDSKTESFWADILYADIPVMQTYDREGPDEHGNISNTINGVISLYTLKFDAPEAVTQIKILPFASQPVKVIGINYRPTLDSKNKIQIKNFRTEESLDWIEYNFETIYASEVEIVFAQENYKKFIIKVPKSILYATDFFIRLQQERAKELTKIPDLLDATVDGTHNIYEEAISDLSSLLDHQDLEKSPITEIDLVGKLVTSMGHNLARFNPQLGGLLEEIAAFGDVTIQRDSDEIETIERYEYVLGAREIECNYIVYSPKGNYESPKFEPKATVVEAALEVDERHPIFSGSYGEYYKTSTEWELEFSSDKKAPIFPLNVGLNNISHRKAENERLDLNFSTRMGITRFPAKFGIVSVRMNNDVLKDNIDYIGTWPAPGSEDGYIQIEILPHVFDKNYIYTITYFVADSAVKLDVLKLFNDKKIEAPDLFEKTESNNDVTLTKIPYVNYEIVNHDTFVYDEDLDGYKYVPPEDPYTVGSARLYPNWINISGSSSSTGQIPIQPSRNVYGFPSGWQADTSGFFEYSGLDLDTTLSGIMPRWATTLDPKYFDHPHRWYLSISGLDGAAFEISQESLGIVQEYGEVPGYTADTTGFFSGHLMLTDQPVLSTGVVGNGIDNSLFNGNLGTSGTAFYGHITVPYKLGIVFDAGSQLFGLQDKSTYAPVVATIGGTEAKNITNYTSLEQQAFKISTSSDLEYQYIHDGKTLYFNQSITSDISVDYRYIVEYVKVNCKLRANKIINPTVTPQINEYRVLLNTTIL
jgi:hypothetical protein